MILIPKLFHTRWRDACHIFRALIAHNNLSPELKPKSDHLTKSDPILVGNISGRHLLLDASMSMDRSGEPRISSRLCIPHSSSKTNKFPKFLHFYQKSPTFTFLFLWIFWNFVQIFEFLTKMAATVAFSGISSGTLAISRPLVTLRRCRAALSYSSSHRLLHHRPISSRRLLFRCAQLQLIFNWFGYPLLYYEKVV